MMLSTCWFLVSTACVVIVQNGKNGHRISVCLLAKCFSGMKYDVKKITTQTEAHSSLLSSPKCITYDVAI